jgi:hypothetical protein
MERDTVIVQIDTSSVLSLGKKYLLFEVHPLGISTATDIYRKVADHLVRDPLHPDDQSMVARQMEYDIMIDSYTYSFLIVVQRGIESSERSMIHVVGVLPFKSMMRDVFTGTSKCIGNRFIALKMVHKTDLDLWINPIELEYRKRPHIFSKMCNQTSISPSMSLSIEYNAISPSTSVDTEIDTQASKSTYIKYRLSPERHRFSKTLRTIWSKLSLSSISLKNALSTTNKPR